MSNSVLFHSNILTQRRLCLNEKCYVICIMSKLIFFFYYLREMSEFMNDCQFVHYLNCNKNVKSLKRPYSKMTLLKSQKCHITKRIRV